MTRRFRCIRAICLRDLRLAVEQLSNPDAKGAAVADPPSLIEPWDCRVAWQDRCTLHWSGDRSEEGCGWTANAQRSASSQVTVWT